MKLYTEEQVKDMLGGFIGSGHVDAFLKRYYTPIELPSDEEIWNEADKEESNSKHYAFTRGARFIKEKIQGGNK